LKATENIDLKLSIFKQLSEACSPDTILSTNTSSISITQIGAVVSNPERYWDALYESGTYHEIS
jgi:3-hydroxybutyryl-CoA dehydrogenase